MKTTLSNCPIRSLKSKLNKVSQLGIKGGFFCGALVSLGALAEVPSSAQLCVTCHGAQGQGIEPLGPKLAGLPAVYISQQISLFQTGLRTNATMQPMSMTVQGPVIEQVAEYFSTQDVTEVSLVTRGSQVVFAEPSAKLVYQGDWSRNLPACATCHGPSTLGGDQFPRLVSQQASYLITQLQAWSSGDRGGDFDGMMANVATKLSSEEIDAVANYLANFK